MHKTRETIDHAVMRFAELITDQVQSLSQAGQNCFDPWDFIARISGEHPTGQQRTAVELMFADGFVWENVSADPRSAASRSYTVLSWA